MIDNGEPFVIEYNCRLGDPETEVVIPRLKNDLVELLQSLYNNNLNSIEVEIDERVAVTTILVSGGYPGNYVTGKIIDGLSENTIDERIIFHSGTTTKETHIITNGGRVIAATAFGNNIKEAGNNSRNLASAISFEGVYYRKDIGYEFD